MISLYRNIKADMIKIKHTAFPLIHYVMAIIGVVTFCCFFTIYTDMEINQKIDIMLELIAVVFPLLIGIVSAILIAQEEKTGKFQVMFIGNGSRIKAYLSKFIVLNIYEIIASILLIGFFIVCMKIFFPMLVIPYKLLIYAIGVFVFGNIEIYLIHLFVNFKFGMGSSIFLGVLESLMVVLFSNIDLEGKWIYIPFSWSIKLCRMLIDNQLNQVDIKSDIQANLYIISLIIVLSITLSLIWFKKWEGRKVYE